MIKPANFKSRRRSLGVLTVVILVLSISSTYVLSQQNVHERLCSGGLSSFLCKAGHAVIGSAANIAKAIINRPKHWGVPDNEPLELHDDYNHRGGNEPPPGPFRGQDSAFRKRERVYCTTFDGTRGVCRPIAACYHRHGPNIRYESESNECPSGASLVCCPKLHHPAQPHKSQFSLLPIKFNDHNPRLNIPITALKEIITQVFAEGAAEAEAERSSEIERNVINEGIALRKHSPSDQHQRFIRLRNDKEVSKLAKDGSDFLAVATRIAKSQRNKQDKDGCKRVINTEDGTTSVIDDCPPETAHQNRNESQPQHRRSSLPQIDFSETSLASRCPGDPVCAGNAARLRFRTYDGSCNNLEHTSWGKSNTPYTRILPPDYEDGVSEIRTTGVTGHKLPNARSVSLSTVRWSEKPDSRTTVMLMQWGQFIDHDLTLAATTPMQTPQGTNIDCCNRRFLSDPRSKHPACISILLPDDDPFYAKFNVGCMNLVRNAPSPPIGCRLRAREQLNQLTHFIDGSMIYGTDQKQAFGLRQFRGGLLKSSRINGMEFLPFDSRIGEGCILPIQGIRRGMRCFVAGDNRVNELTGLVTMHALFLREHNRVARILWSLNREWNDEKIFQEARRIVSIHRGKNTR